MLKTEHEEVFNWAGAVRGMRNPLESWKNSDSFFIDRFYCLGENDEKLMKKLVVAGSDHRKFLRQIMISVDITAPLYWWKEFDTYKIGTTANSTSTMHFIHKNEITLKAFSFDTEDSFLETLVEELERLRKLFITTKDKTYWRKLIQQLPSSFNQKRTVTLNYEVAYNIYFSRKKHKLTEWHTLCNWIRSLQYFTEICLGGKENEKRCY